MRMLFIGGINRNNAPRGGEEYKNQLILKKLAFENLTPTIIDTTKWKVRPETWIRLFISILISEFDKIVISASSASAYKLIKLIGYIRPSLLQKTSYLVVGGYFPEAIEWKVFKWEKYRKLKNIVVQGDKLKNKLLKNTKLSNISTIPNFKEFPGIKSIKTNSKKVFKFVFVGRISQGKGIREIIKASEILKLQNIVFCVDFYGPVEGQFPLNDGILNYKGFLDIQGDPVNSYIKLSEYDCMLFPTYWMGEGFPGVIVDAFIAGLPVIASDWNMNSEIIKDGKNGYLIEPKNAEALAEKMFYVMENKEKLQEIRRNNLARAKDYHIDTVWPELLKLL